MVPKTVPDVDKEYEIHQMWKHRIKKLFYLICYKIQPLISHRSVETSSSDKSLMGF